MREIKEKCSICKEGKLNKDSVGWCKKVFANCNIEKGYFRKKVWNHYMFMNEKFICAFAIVKLDYAGLIFIDFYDLKKNSEIHKSVTIPLCNGMIIHNAIGSYAHFENKDLYMNIIRRKNKLNATIRWDEIDIDAKFNITKESLNVLIPWSDKKFHYTSKQFPLKVQGIMRVGEEKFERFDLNNSTGFIDYGRGIWPREKAWYWLTCAFKLDDNMVGINLGGKWTDGTGVNENAIRIGKKIYKIYTDLRFDKVDEDTWHITSVDDELEDINLVFKSKNVYDKVNNRFIVKSSLKQHRGKLSGTININDEVIEIKEVLCWFEDHYAKW